MDFPWGSGWLSGAKRTGKTYRTFVLMGDGEQAEGSIWEAAMAGSHYQLDNLFGIVDRNHLQISGNTEDVMALENLADKWGAFGWDVHEVDGHNIGQILDVIERAGKREGKPHLIIAHTTKGKGVSFMENVAKWHHGVPTDEQLAQAVRELGGEADERTM